MWNINGNQYEFDIEDYEQHKRYMTAVRQLQAYGKEIENKKIEESEVIKLYALAYYQFFDTLFGEGTGDDLFGKKYNIRVCEETYLSFIDFVAQTKIQQEARRKRIAAYLPKR